jgi:GNAT superfamily N-acetyltransferase
VLVQADPSRITRRPATPADTSWARRLHHAAVRDVVERQFGSWDQALQDRYFHDDWTAGGFDVIEYDGTPCGYVCIEERPADVNVREIDIDPAFQRRGIGTAMIAHAIELARERGVPVVLRTLHENHAARLYRRLGFAETDTTDTHILFRLEPEAPEARVRNSTGRPGTMG